MLSDNNATKTLIAADVILMIVPVFSLLWFTRYRQESYAWEASALFVTGICCIVYDVCDIATMNRCPQAHDAIQSLYDQSCLFLMSVAFSPFLTELWRSLYLGTMSCLCTLFALLYEQQPVAIGLAFTFSFIPYLVGYLRFLYHHILEHKILLPAYTFGIISVSFRINSSVQSQDNTSDYMFQISRAMWRTFAALALALIYADIAVDSTSLEPIYQKVNTSDNKRSDTFEAAPAAVSISSLSSISSSSSSSSPKSTREALLWAQHHKNKYRLFLVKAAQNMRDTFSSSSSPTSPMSDPPASLSRTTVKFRPGGR